MHHLALFALAPAVAPLAQFGEPVDLTSSPESADALVAADFDGDGDQDIIVASVVDRSVGFLELQDDGAFAPLRPLDSPGTRIRGMVAGDLNADGALDLVLVSWQPGEEITVLDGRGDGTFEAPRGTGSTGDWGRRPRLLDLDLDGDLDLVVESSRPFGQPPSILWNLGGGALGPAAPITLEGAVALDAGDLDGDGDPDLVLAERSGRIRPYRNDGAGAFTALPEILGFTLARRLDLVDLDLDGTLDLLLGDGDEEILTLRGLGGFSFDAPATTLLPASPGAYELDLSDVDSDGDPDLVAVAFAGGSVTWLENVAGDLQPGQPLNSDGLDRVITLTVGEVTADGRPDLLVGRSDGGVAVLSSNPFASGPIYTTPPREITRRVPGVSDLAWADLDLDGDIDVIAASAESGLWLAPNRGFEAFGLPAPLSAGLDAATLVQARDLDADGRPDLLAVDGDSRLLVLWNETGGTWTREVLATRVAGEARAADLDDDGDLDLVFGTESGALAARDQLAPRAFDAPRTAVALPRPPTGLELGDVSDDGILDILTVERSPQTVNPPSVARWYRGAGDGTFLAGDTLVELGTGLRTFGVRDFAAGLAPPTLHWTNFGSNAIQSAFRFSTGTYTVLQPPPIAASVPRLLAFGRSEPNLTPDLVVGSAPSQVDDVSRLELFPALGAGFRAPSDIGGVLRGATALEFADLDGDGDDDLLLAAEESGRIRWIPNETVDPIGVNYCGPAVPNSTGHPASMSAVGSVSIAAGDLTLRAVGLPEAAPTLFLAARVPGATPTVGGGQGTLCLGGAIGRFAGQLGPANDDGAATLRVDLTALPSPGGAVAATPGSLWYFQAWYRDTVNGHPTSNLTDGLAVVLR